MFPMDARHGCGMALAVLAAWSGHAAEPLAMPPMYVTAEAERAGAENPALAVWQALEPAAGGRLDAAFRQVPGLIAQESFGGFDPPRLAVRGSGIQSAPSSRGLMISWLGMPLNAADGSFNLALIEGAWIDEASATRGPAAGVAALGGSLDLGSDIYQEGGGIGALYGSHDHIGLAARAAWAEDGRAVAGRAAWQRGDGWRPRSRQQRESVFAATRVELRPDTELDLRFHATRPWYEVPGPLTKRDALENPTMRVPAVEQDRPFRETGQAQVAARLATRWRDSRATFAIGGVTSDDEFRQLAANGISRTEANELWLAADYVKEWPAANQQTRVFAQVQSGWWDARRYRNDSGRDGALIGDLEMLPLTLQAGIDHHVRLPGRQRLEIGGSVLGARREIRDLSSPALAGGPLGVDFSGMRFAPRLAWVWSPRDTLEITAGWARSHEAPTCNDMLFTDGPIDARILRSQEPDWQRADSFELGARGSHGRLSWSSHVYYAPWRGELLRLVDENGSPRGTVNAGRTIHSGWESAIEWRLPRESGGELALRATYNLSDAVFDGDPVYGNRHLAGVPPHSGALELRASTQDGWYVAPGLQWQAGETYGDHFNTLGYGGYVICGLEIGRRHPAGWSLSVGIYNALDRAAVASTAGVLDRAPDPRNAAIFLPASGRGVEVKFEYSW
jgi:iron complex outermembrane receptor protein